jgi:hypothetical protein
MCCLSRHSVVRYPDPVRDPAVESRLNGKFRSKLTNARTASSRASNDLNEKFSIRKYQLVLELTRPAHRSLVELGREHKDPSSMERRIMEMEQVKTKSVQPHQRFTLPEVTWEQLDEPGAYVELGSGEEALIPGGSPIIHKESIGASRLVQVSRNPFVTTLQARLSCAQHNIEPNF